jgi:hypothetical protein
MGKRKPLAIEIVWSQLLLCGGEWKTRKAIYEELLAEGFERRYVDFYLFHLSQNQPKEEELLKTLDVTGTKGSPITLCPKCKQVKEETTAFFQVPLYPELPNADDTLKTVQPEMLNIPFRPMYYCQCEKIKAEVENL